MTTCHVMIVVAVIDGFETLDLIEKVPVDPSNDKPVAPIISE
jgi:hypothetical protein